MALQLGLAKAGEKVGKLRLNLKKGARFTVELFWDSQHDLDAHALLGANDGTGAKVTDFAQVLSAYNTKKNNPNAALTNNPNGSFGTPCGTLLHSGDSRSGENADVDEIITVDSSKTPNGVNEIPIVVTIHDAAAKRATFAQVKSAGIRIRDDGGTELANFALTNEFGRFNAVQMGSLCLGDDGWSFHPVGAGFNGDFNTVLENFS